jgi:hypothetical protein
VIFEMFVIIYHSQTTVTIQQDNTKVSLVTSHHCY